MTTLEEYRAIGSKAIRGGGAETSPLPWDFADIVFRCAWEYPVVDFEAEVGFYLRTLGFSTLALDQEYALFSTPDRDLTFACRRREDATSDYTGHILCFMTKDIEAFASTLQARASKDAVTRLAGSPVQTVLRLESPAGLQIDIWEFPT